MMKGIQTPLVLIAVVLMGTVVSSSGCRKKKDTVAKVYVHDEAGNRVSGAQVQLKGTSTLPPGEAGNVVLHKTSTSNASGEAIFSFNDVYQLGQAGVAVVDIIADKGNLHGTGIMKVEQETTTEERVFVIPQ